MAALGLASLLGRVPATAWRAARSPLLFKLPEGRFDAPEDSNLEKELLTKFPDDINPVTKEKGGPRDPEPTRYGDWERKGRCINF
ncbi:hypothetical protein FD754_005876 [Muntiacus muntjak]|uniref:Succinate dehydrogenase assembly factor 4, mitochondrial n=1 Tax=Muntiacus muntjak TaxID=9888 RepID=A0A5N3WIW8_MUNMU|nr:hypothetical protein FD754_005876 [Muntiacus muntjak]